MRIAAYALAPDGGTQLLVLEMDDGGKLTVGLDGRMDSPAGMRQLFIGDSPDGAGTRMLPVDGSEEREIISLLDQWLDETQGFLRRKALMETDPSDLKDQDLLDRMAIELLLELRNRDLA